MNIIDIIILAILGVSILYGMHRGFIDSVLGIAAVVVSIGVAFALSGQVAEKLKENETLVNTLLYYTDAGSRISDLDLSTMPASSIRGGVLETIVKKANLPESFETVFVEALQKTASNGAQTVSAVLSRTIVDVSISIISFLVTFLIAYLIMLFLVHMISYVFEFPVLKHLNALIGGIFGGIRGILLVFILFSLIPLIMAVVPIEQVGNMISESKLAPMFDSKIILMILNRL